MQRKELKIGDQVNVTLKGVIVEKYKSMRFARKEPNSMEESHTYCVYLHDIASEGTISVEMPCDYGEEQIPMEKIT